MESCTGAPCSRGNTFRPNEKSCELFQPPFRLIKDFREFRRDSSSVSANRRWSKDLVINGEIKSPYIINSQYCT